MLQRGGCPIRWLEAAAICPLVGCSACRPCSFYCAADRIATSTSGTTSTSTDSEGLVMDGELVSSMTCYSTNTRSADHPRCPFRCPGVVFLFLGCAGLLYPLPARTPDSNHGLPLTTARAQYHYRTNELVVVVVVVAVFAWFANGGTCPLFAFHRFGAVLLTRRRCVVSSLVSCRASKTSSGTDCCSLAHRHTRLICSDGHVQ